MEQLGETGRGNAPDHPDHRRQIEGEGITGTVRPGAWDWQLDRPDGCTTLIADYFVETDDGAVINVHNRATVCPPGGRRGAAADLYPPGVRSAAGPV